MSERSLILPDAILNCSPSSVAGVPHFVEVQYRMLGCELIQLAGIMLRTYVVQVRPRPWSHTRLTLTRLPLVARQCKCYAARK